MSDLVFSNCSWRFADVKPHISPFVAATYVGPMLRLCFVIFAFVSGMVSVSATEPFEAFRAKHCLRRHGPEKEEGDTIRQRIEAHAKNANCAACHRNIDPLGLAFDQYDAIGQWRTREHVPTGVGEDPMVDASGLMPDGRPFSDSVQFRRLLLEDRDKVARAFIEHLCTYALRRVLTVDDEGDLKTIEEEAKENDYRVKDIVRAVALSELIQKR